MRKKTSIGWFTAVLLAATILGTAATLGARQAQPGQTVPPASSRPAKRTQPPPTQEPATRPRAAAVNPVTPATTEITDRDFAHLLRLYPEAAKTIRLDQSLLTNQEYLEHYPDLRDYLQAHPQILQNLDYFVRHNPYFGEATERGDPVVMQIMNDLWPFLVFLVVAGALLWILRVILENRRWSKMAKIQEEAHTKLLEKFATNQDLLSYMQTEAGKRFLESAPIPIDLEQRPRMSAPLGRILWSIQLGFILALAGVGLLFVRNSVPDAAEPLLVFGTLGLMLGLGFIVSAGVSYGLSKHLGLLERATASAGSAPAGSSLTLGQ
jgi:hypothetical protein